jgi:hypothetical protein
MMLCYRTATSLDITQPHLARLLALGTPQTSQRMTAPSLHGLQVAQARVSREYGGHPILSFFPSMVRLQ